MRDSFFRNLTPRLVVLPVVLVMLVCFYGSIVWTAYISTTRSGMLPNYDFVGFTQYVRLFATPRWITAYGNMFIFGVLMVLGTLALGTLLAILMDAKLRFENLFRTVLLYPLSMSYIVTGLAWQWVLSPSIGVQNFVRQLGWPDFTFDWIVQRDYAIYTLVFAAVWHQAGLIMAIMLAGLRGVDGEIWRAARMEGLPRARVYWSIVLPMLRPLMVTCVVLLAIAVVKSYDLVVAMTGGGPGNASDLPGRFVVDLTFERANLGLASAAAVVMLGTVIAALAPYFYFETSRRSR
ncbi:carbohydrate ABC transporter permease [Roseomonas elaeocarpi]|uniref:Carbohydrate ABC transporter permease n=1 Tax=Roseomonas elaeocarpi TaxID=907779 RepID=A0ABV6JMG3_9PROT